MCAFRRARAILTILAIAVWPQWTFFCLCQSNDDNLFAATRCFVAIKHQRFVAKTKTAAASSGINISQRRNFLHKIASKSFRHARLWRFGHCSLSSINCFASQTHFFCANNNGEGCFVVAIKHQLLVAKTKTASASREMQLILVSSGISVQIANVAIWALAGRDLPFGLYEIPRESADSLPKIKCRKSKMVGILEHLKAVWDLANRDLLENQVGNFSKILTI